MASRVPLVKQVETLNYRFGGFHPVHLGEQFKKDRYHVIHKLGHGGFATVWLARDRVRQRYVALKILASRLSQDCPEVEILRRLKSSSEHIGKPYVMSMLDHFWIEGPNGKHLCVVSEVGGPSIQQFNNCPGQFSGTRRLRAFVARKVALQASEGLAYIHSTGTVHGDFTCANILLQLANIDEWSVEQIYERLGKPQTQDLNQISDRLAEPSDPKYTVTAINMKEVDPQWLSDQIMIIDFGIAFLQDQSSTDIGTPKSYYAPEFLFNNARSVSSDIWALGCTIFEIRTGSCLFRYKGKPTRNQMLIAMVKLLGDLPRSWWSDWEEGRKWYEIQSVAGGELAEIMGGTLYHQITEIGTHDGDYPVVNSTSKDESLGHDTVDKSRKKNTAGENDSNISRMIALVEELTTSEAADVISQIKKSTVGSSRKNISNSATSSNEKSASGSSNAKSAEKSISSEGISTGISTGATLASLGPRAKNVIGKEGLNIRGSIKDATASAAVEEFLELAGTRISMVEAEGLENLLRKLLTYLPEQRLAPSEVAKHHWFFDSFED